MAEPGDVIDVVRSEGGSRELRQEVVLLVGPLRRSEDRQGVGPGLLSYLPKPSGREREGLIPGDPGHPLPPPHQGSLQPVGMVDEVGGEPPLDAEPPPGDGVGRGGGGTHDPAVLDVEDEAAAAAAVDADGGDLLQKRSLLGVLGIGGTRPWRYYPFGWRIEEVEDGTAKKR
ncbi:MAG: hypothetical protein METHAR1v1_1730010, partial [Methanothrix sp.]